MAIKTKSKKTIKTFEEYKDIYSTKIDEEKSKNEIDPIKIAWKSLRKVEDEIRKEQCKS